jgi:large subunit ribosomal protein L30
MSESTNSEVKMLTIKWMKSAIGYGENQKRTLKALGFTRLGQVIQQPDVPQIRGMINTVRHLVNVK